MLHILQCTASLPAPIQEYSSSECQPVMPRLEYPEENKGLVTACIGTTVGYHQLSLRLKSQLWFLGVRKGPRNIWWKPSVGNIMALPGNSGSSASPRCWQQITWPHATESRPVSMFTKVRGSNLVSLYFVISISEYSFLKKKKNRKQQQGEKGLDSTREVCSVRSPPLTSH